MSIAGSREIEAFLTIELLERVCKLHRARRCHAGAVDKGAHAEKRI